MNIEFDPSRVGVLFFSRGRGRGHAIPDIAIVEELSKIRDDLDVRFVSYATGAATLAERGHTVIDIDLPEANPFLETLVIAAKLLAWLRPQLVVSHEEFAALPAAKILDLPTVMITDWFVKPERLIMSALQYSDEILFIDEAGIYEEPAYLKGKIRYVGPVLRDFEYRRADRARAREELDLPPEGPVISVFPGQWSNEERAPLADLLLPAFEALESPDKRLIWLAGDDCDLLRERTRDLPGVIIKEYDWQIDRLMVASDLAITKTNRKTAQELAALGVPSLSVSYGLNPICDLRASRIPTNTALQADQLTSEKLVQVMEELISAFKLAASAQASDQQSLGGRVAAARRLAHHVEKVLENARPESASEAGAAG
jgi:UDP-N-acetylglucosamine:LPS N-acetylglucosamine transferase